MIVEDCPDLVIDSRITLRDHMSALFTAGCSVNTVVDNASTAHALHYPSITQTGDSTMSNFENIDHDALVAVSGGLSEQASLNQIIQHESGGNVHAKNPHSTAFGLGQLLYANRVHYLGRANANTTNYNQQLGAMQHYIKDRYGNAQRAWGFWQKHHWY